MCSVTVHRAQIYIKANKKIEQMPRTHVNVSLRFCIVWNNELVVLDSIENSKQYKNSRNRFRVYGDKDFNLVSMQIIFWMTMVIVLVSHAE